MFVTRHRYTKNSIAAIIPMVVMLFFAISCSEKKEKDKIAAVEDRASIPKLDATQITTVVSDSGITRYRISAPKWLMYDKAANPYWSFPDGIVLEKFNLELDVDASIVSDHARFEENTQIWELNGNVVAINLQGEMFETEQLFWNQKTERIYSDSLIKITRETSIITGIGFESNQTMSNYTIRNPQGIFPISEEKDSTQATSPTPVHEETAVPIAKKETLLSDEKTTLHIK